MLEDNLPVLGHHRINKICLIGFELQKKNLKLVFITQTSFYKVTTTTTVGATRSVRAKYTTSELALNRRERAQTNHNRNSFNVHQWDSRVKRLPYIVNIRYMECSRIHHEGITLLLIVCNLNICVNSVSKIQCTHPNISHVDVIGNKFDVSTPLS